MSTCFVAKSRDPKTRFAIFVASRDRIFTTCREVNVETFRHVEGRGVVRQRHFASTTVFNNPNLNIFVIIYQVSTNSNERNKHLKLFLYIVSTRDVKFTCLKTHSLNPSWKTSTVVRKYTASWSHIKNEFDLNTCDSNSETGSLYRFFENWSKLRVISESEARSLKQKEILQETSSFINISSFNEKP